MSRTSHTTTGPKASFLRELGVEGTSLGASWGEWVETGGETIASVSPADESVIGTVKTAVKRDYERVMEKALAALETWRMTPAPTRGEMVRLCGEEFRKFKKPLGDLISLEMGKIRSEGEGEVQEMIDIADFAVGLSRQLYGLSMHSERAGHRMYEQWHPLGAVGVITAFNFPGAVWAWNAMIAAVCGDVVLWKPSLKTPLTAVAIQRMCDRVMKDAGCPGVFNVVIGSDLEIGETLVADARIPLVSATGSCRMGRRVNEIVAKRLGRCLLELGGNNAIIVTEDADLELALRGILFGAVGTAGQRCTTTRRVFLHRSLASRFTERLAKAYRSVKIGDPLEAGVLMGPLIDGDAVRMFEKAIERVLAQGGSIVCGGKRIERPGFFVEPTIVKAKPSMEITREETFAPIVYLFEYDDLDEAIGLQNDVLQGLSSAIFTRDLRAAETFLSSRGSDCGIANVNLGTSGAEIGGAFGGEKETGGGREAGSDAWKAYMRRQTCTINWSKELPLAQGVKFDVA